MCGGCRRQADARDDLSPLEPELELELELELEHELELELELPGLARKDPGDLGAKRFKFMFKFRFKWDLRPWR